MPLMRLFLAGAVLACSASMYATSPFVGKWKIDPAKSHMAGTSDSVAAAGPNRWTFQYGAFTWTVKADGTDQPTPFGNTISMKVVDRRTWEFTNKNNGKLIGTDTWVLSGDGKSMTRTFRGQKENGEPSTGVAIMKRTAGASGFEGVWESTEVKMPFTEIDIEPNGDDGITLKIPGDGTMYSLKFDGKEYPEQGPRIPAGTTVSARMAGARTARATTKVNGKVFDTEDWEVSADGTTFTYTEHDAGVAQPVVVVLRRLGE